MHTIDTVLSLLTFDPLIIVPGCWADTGGFWYLHCQDGHGDSRQVHRGQTGEALANQGNVPSFFLPEYAASHSSTEEGVRSSLGPSGWDSL